MKNVALISLVGFIVTGCTTVGNSNFSCRGIESGVRCIPSSSAYDEIHASGYDGETLSPSTVETQIIRNGVSTGKGSHMRYYEEHHPSRPQTSESAVETEPLLELPIGDKDSLVLVNPPTSEYDPQYIGSRRERVWINSFSDHEDRFHEARIVFFVSEKAGWGRPKLQFNNHFEPLKN